MVKRIAKASYDAEEDILYVRLGKPVKDSLSIGDFVVDFSSEGRIIGLEVLNASRHLAASLPAGADSRKLLAAIRSARFAAVESRGLVWVTIALELVAGAVRYQPSLQIPLPQAVLAK